MHTHEAAILRDFKNAILNALNILWGNNFLTN